VLMDTTATRLLAKTNPNLRADMLKAARVYEEKFPSVTPTLAKRCGMVQEQIRQDSLAVNFEVRAADDEVMDWTRQTLLAYGFTAAAADLTKTTLAAYARWIAREALSKGTMSFLPFSAFIDEEHEPDYWRAIAIAATKGPTEP